MPSSRLISFLKKACSLNNNRFLKQIPSATLQNPECVPLPSTNPLRVLFFRILSVFLLIRFFWSPLLHAQPVDQDMPADSVAIGFVPAFAYNSDFGLIGGGILNRYDYRGGKPPFRNFTNAYLVASSKGLFRVATKFDQVKTFGTDIRSLYEVYSFRTLQDYYFGIGNNTTFDPKAFVNTDLYYFKSFGYGLNYLGRKAVWRGGGISRFDVLFGGNFSYVTPYQNGGDRLLMQDRPTGFAGGFVNWLSTGILFENRDSEFRPTSGQYVFADISYSHRAMGSDFNFGRMQAMASGYTSFFLVRDIVAAARIGGMSSWGSVPFWMLSRLGGDGNLRGYPVGRFTDRNAMYYNAELRTWLWELWEGDVRLGGQLFIDGGRVFPGGIPSALFQDHHLVYGFGGAMSAFTPDFFLRGDVGFSDELYRVYISIGYAF